MSNKSIYSKSNGNRSARSEPIHTQQPASGSKDNLMWNKTLLTMTPLLVLSLSVWLAWRAVNAFRLTVYQK